MASKEIVSRVATQAVKPFFSKNQHEARKKTLELYREWQRTIPLIHMLFDIPISTEQMRQSVRDKFREHKNITDVRMIDGLVWKGQMELRETREMWKTRTHVMMIFGQETKSEPKKTDFLSKFYDGQP